MRRRKLTSGVAAMTVVLLLATNVLAGTTGKIAGRAVDKENGDPLIGANVVVAGTSIGAATDQNGYYFLLQVPPGSYSVKASMMGYTPVTVTGVKVTVDVTRTVDFKLAPTVLEIGSGVTIVAERPIIEKDVTFSSHRLSEESIKNMPTVLDVRDVVARQPGVVGEGIHINVRGGRTGEMLYVVDGMSTRDPMYNQATRSTDEQVTQFTDNPVDELTSRSGGNAVPMNAIAEVEVITGGFNAEYGNAMSGIVNIVTREGGQRQTGRVLYMTDDFGRGSFKDLYGQGEGLRKYSHNTDRVEVSFGGPEPVTTYLLSALGLRLPVQEITYFISGTGNWTDVISAFDVGYYSPTGEDRSDENPQLKFLGFDQLALGLPNRMDNRYNSLSNLTVRFSPKTKLTYTYQTDRSYYDEYNHAWSQLPEIFWQREEESTGHTLKWTHTLGEKSYYDLALSYRDQRYLLTPGGLLPPQIRELYLAPPLNGRLTEIDNNQDGFFEAGFPDRGTYHSRKTITNALKLDVTSQVHRRHQIKSGLELNYYEMIKGEIKYPHSYNAGWDPAVGGTPVDGGPWPELGIFRDFFFRTPFAGAIYMQDKIEYENLIVNLGFRWDFWAPGEQVEDEIDEGSDLFGRKTKSTFNPRLGIAHPITERDRLYFQFGRFTQSVDYQFLFLQDTQSSGALKLFGNPNIGSEETTQYEIGVEHAFGDEVKLDVTAYFKDYNGLLNTEKRGRPPFEYDVYVNRDYGSGRGIELSLEKRYSHFTSGFINYTYGYATGKSSSYRQGYDYGARGREVPIREWPLDWDVRHALNLNLDFRVQQGEGPQVFGFKLPDKWGANMVWRFETGKPYTPGGQAETQFTTKNSARLPARTWVDVRVNKDFHWLGMKYQFLLEVKNLTNRRNARAVNSETGEVVGFFRPEDLNPSAYTPGRNIQLGLAIEW